MIHFPIPIIFAILLNEVHRPSSVCRPSAAPRFISTVVVIAILGELLPSTGIFNILRQQWFGLPDYF